MSPPIGPQCVFDVDVSAPIADRPGLDGYSSASVLVRVGGTPVGVVSVAVRDGTCLAEDIQAAIDGQLDGDPGALAEPARAKPQGPWPTLTVAVCTRARPDDLAVCLESLVACDYPALEIIVVDNAPTNDANVAVCATWPQVQRVVEPRPGLNWARNRALLTASGEIIAFTDDDVRVDRDWARELVAPFLRDEDVGAVAGLAIALELETPAQILFERYGGVSGGFRHMRMQGSPDWGARGMWHYALMAPHGSGANMAFRRSVFDATGMFDPALDVGTVTNGGGDMDMLFRVLVRGFAMVYEPRAIVRHRHRRDYAGVSHQISGWGTGMSAFLTRSAMAFPQAWWVMALLGLRGYGLLVARVMRPGNVPRGLVVTHLQGALVGPFRYWRARALSRQIERTFGAQTRSAPA